MCSGTASFSVVGGGGGGGGGALKLNIKIADLFPAKRKHFTSKYILLEKDLHV